MADTKVPREETVKKLVGQLRQHRMTDDIPSLRRAVKTVADQAKQRQSRQEGRGRTLNPRPRGRPTRAE